MYENIYHDCIGEMIRLLKITIPFHSVIGPDTQRECKER